MEEKPVAYPPMFIENLVKVKGEPRKAKYRCFCGNEFIATLYAIRKEIKKSCGCFAKASVTYRNVVRTKYRKEDFRLSRIWKGMLYRCYNPKAVYYCNYGAKGITVCEEWMDFKKFVEWSRNNGYEDTLTVDRKDNTLGYSPNNCQWSTYKIQNINKRSPIPKSGYSGVSVMTGGRFHAVIRVNKKTISLGSYLTAEEASAAYQKAKEERDIMYLEEFNKKHPKI